MRLSELAELVQDLQDQLDDTDRDPVVKIAHQPSYPLAASVRGVVDNLDPDQDEDRAGDHFADEDVVWLVAGESSDYAPRRLWNGVW